MDERSFLDDPGDLLQFPVPGQLPLHRHRPGCTFGPGFFKVVYHSEGTLHTHYFQEEAEAESFKRLLPDFVSARFYRDACLDEQDECDAATPDVVDGEWWLGLPMDQAMAELGLRSPADYARVYRMVEDMVYLRGNRQSQGDVRVPIVLKRRRTPQTRDTFQGGAIHRIRLAR